MENIFYDELRRCCKEINNNLGNEEMTDKVIEAFHRSIALSNGARKEGILYLEEMSEELDLKDDLQSFLHQQLTLVVDGTDPEFVFRIGMNHIVANAFKSYDGLIALLYLIASLEIQAGTNPRIFEELLMSIMPSEIREELMMRECRDALPKALSEAEETKIRIEDLCADDTEADEKDHSLTNQTTLTLLELSDKEMMRVLRDTDNRDCSLAMKGLPGKARKRIFDNLSTNLSAMVVDDMEFMGPVRMHDVEEACIRILRTILKLEDSAELESHDFSVLKVVLDSRDIAERENKALKERYKELHRIIDDIYHS